MISNYDLLFKLKNSTSSMPSVLIKRTFDGNCIRISLLKINFEFSDTMSMYAMQDNKS